MSTQTLDADKLKKLVMASFMAEKNCDISAGMDLVHEDFSVTDMVLGKSGDHLPSLSGVKLRDLMKLAFTIKGREFTFKSVIADEQTQTVIIEFIESYPDPVTNQVYRTPQVAVCEVKDGKIYRTRHYMDPRLSFESLASKQIEDVFEQ